MNKSQEQKLDKLMDFFNHLPAPIPAIPAIPSIPAIPAIPPIPQYSGDHDLLVKLDTKMTNLQEAFEKVSNNYVTTSDALKHSLEDDKTHKEQQDTLNIHAKAINENSISIARIQTWGAATVIGIGIITTLLNHFWH